MKKKPVIAHCNFTEVFRIKEYTRVSVTIQCKRTKLSQRVRIERKRGDEVVGNLKEFGGSKYQIAINLRHGIVTLVAPDYSWLEGAETMLQIVVAKMADMLEMRFSSRAFKITREEEQLEC